MPNYCTDDKWRFNYQWEKMQKRVTDLESKVDRLERWKAEQIEKEYIRENRK
jgi:hypothetical protein